MAKTRRKRSANSGTRRKRAVVRRPPFTIPDCKRFTGYKPCFPYTTCYDKCVDNVPIGTRILIVNLDAMGHVLQTTALLPAIKRKYPQSHISWITLHNTHLLLQNITYLDAVYVWEPESWLILQSMKFDVLMNVDKSRRSCGFAMAMDAKKKLGFGLNENGVIVPFNREAHENYLLGLDDSRKFRANDKPGVQILHETFGLEFRRDEYILELTSEEKAFCVAYRRKLDIPEDHLVVGFNTGCSTLYPNKKMTVEQHAALIGRLSQHEGLTLLLLGGKEDTVRNAEIERRVGTRIISTPTTEGIRRGICYENVCDVVVTGDSYGMHLAVALNKYVIVWFGVSSWTEIDLYGRGEKLIPEGLACSPCWKQRCPYNLECIQMIDLDRIVGLVLAYRQSKKFVLNEVAVPDTTRNREN